MLLLPSTVPYSNEAAAAAAAADADGSLLPPSPPAASLPRPMGRQDLEDALAEVRPSTHKAEEYNRVSAHGEGGAWWQGRPAVGTAHVWHTTCLKMSAAGPLLRHLQPAGRVPCVCADAYLPCPQHVTTDVKDCPRAQTVSTADALP